MFEHLDEVPVGHHRFIITACKHLLLFLESCSLIERIIELAVPIPDLRSSDNHLKSFDRSRILYASLRERRDEGRMIHEKCGTSNLLASVFPEGISETLTIGSVVLHSEFIELRTHRIIGRSEDIDSCFLSNRCDVVDSAPLIREVEGMSSCTEDRLPIDFLCDISVHLLDESHSHLIVSISPIEFHIREFLEVIWTRSLIAIGTSDLEGLRETSCHETLLPEFSDGDTQKYIDIIVIMVRGKWSSLCSTSRMLEGRSIDFEESFRYEKISSRFPEVRLPYE